MAQKFTAELRCQQEWGWLLAAWLFLGGTGSALYLLFLIADLPAIVALVSLAILCLGGLVLLYELGNPLRAWRGFTRASTSWLSRGVISVTIFVVFAALFVAPDFALFSWLPWRMGDALGRVFGWIAGLAALMIVLYPGFFLAKNRSIPFWHTPILPFVLIGYAGTGASGVVLLMSPYLSGDLSWVSTLALVLILVSTLLLAIFLLAGAFAGGPAEESVKLLNRGATAWFSWLGVVLIGTALPLAAILWYESLLSLAGAGILIGGFIFRYCLLRIGVYVPAALVAEAGLDFSRLNRTSANLEREYASMAGHGASRAE